MAVQRFTLTKTTSCLKETPANPAKVSLYIPRFQEPYYQEKQSPEQKPRPSKRRLWRLFRLGIALILTITGLVLNLVILVDAGGDLSLLTIDMSNFAQWDPPTITLVHNSTDPSKTRRGLGSWASDVASAAGSAEDSVESAVSGAADAAESAAGSAVTAVGSAVSAAETAAVAEADKIIDDIGDGLEELENAVTGLMDKVLDTIQDKLNEWLQDVASSLDDLTIPKKLSVHMTTYCVSNSSDSSNSSNSTSNETTTSAPSCNGLFSLGGDDSFNSTTNNGTVFGFQPGSVLSKALGVFFVPESAREDIREPVDSAANEVEKLVHEAGNDISSWTRNILFGPIVAVFIIACVFTGILLLMLLAAGVFSLRTGESLPPMVYSLCGTLGALAAFFLLLGSVIVTVIGLVAWVVGKALDVVDISVSSSSELKWLSWAACVIMVVVAGCLKVEEFVADCLVWWRFLRSILRARKNKDEFREVIRKA
ncbi:hypothetical protein VMCG_04139 [Cytospora schulzeri]|uniref:Uncharacterized protein n=1 Tax=Cytospora schulzeri TaxID=448051 RepID=A0A423WUE1_9PEZI|nr:hypothetical protein VMCG_04139 [Valsa malicola]